MLKFLQGKVSDRKLRLFACACVRRVWPVLPHGLPHEVVRLSEDYADGTVTSTDLARFRKPARNPVLHPSNFVPLSLAALLRPDFSSQGASAIAEAVTRFVGWGCRGGRPVEYDIHQEVVQAESKAQTTLLFDLFGNPFQPLPAIDPAWLGWAGGTVKRLAQAVYDERTFDRMPDLGDALEAGCDNQEILLHCRQQERHHVRGCWVLDMILGKK
jgi:hypothetical protein